MHGPLRPPVGPDPALADEPGLQRFHHPGIELGPCVGDELGESLVLGHPPAIGPVGGHGVESVAHRQDARAEVDLLPAHPMGIPLPVKPLVVLQEDGEVGGIDGEVAEDPRADLYVSLHRFELLEGEGAKLQQDAVPDCDLPDIVDPGNGADRESLVLGHPQEACDLVAHLGHPPGVLPGHIIPLVEEVREGREHLLRLRPQPGVGLVAHLGHEQGRDEHDSSERVDLPEQRHPYRQAHEREIHHDRIAQPPDEHAEDGEALHLGEDGHQQEQVGQVVGPSCGEPCQDLHQDRREEPPGRERVEDLVGRPRGGSGQDVHGEVVQRLVVNPVGDDIGGQHADPCHEGCWGPPEGEQDEQDEGDGQALLLSGTAEGVGDGLHLGDDREHHEDREEEGIGLRFEGLGLQEGVPGVPEGRKPHEPGDADGEEERALHCLVPAGGGSATISCWTRAKTPRAMRRSPTLNARAKGNQDGVRRISARNKSRACASAPIVLLW